MDTQQEKLRRYQLQLKEIRHELDALNNSRIRDENRLFELLEDMDTCLTNIERCTKRLTF